MKNQTVIFLLLGVVVVIGVVSVVTRESNKPVSGTVMMEADTATSMDSPDTMTAGAEVTEDTMMDKPQATETMAGSYVTYSPEALAALPADQKVVLFFKATWCPSCRALDADIKANLSTIPAGVTIMEVDYDTNTVLRRQYGVTTQHTLVQVDTTGVMVAKNSGTPTVATLVGQLQ